MYGDSCEDIRTLFVMMARRSMRFRVMARELYVWSLEAVSAKHH